MNKPILLKPAFKDYLWGGTNLRTIYGKDCHMNPIAEKAGSFPPTKTDRALLQPENIKDFLFPNT